MYLRLVGADRYAAKFLVQQGKYIQKGDVFKISDKDGKRLLRERAGVFEEISLCDECKIFVKMEEIQKGLCPDCYEKEQQRKSKKPVKTAKPNLEE